MSATVRRWLIAAAESSSAQRLLSTRLGDLVAGLIWQASRFTNHQLAMVRVVPVVFGSTGNRRPANALLRRATTSQNEAVLEAGHSLAADGGDDRLAKRFEAALRAIDADASHAAVARRRLADGDVVGAERSAADVSDYRVQSELCFGINLMCGRMNKVTQAIAASTAATRIATFDALWATGDVDAALAAADPQSVETLRSRLLFRRLVAGYRLLGNDITQLEAIVDERARQPEHLDTVVEAWFDLNRLDMIRATHRDLLGASGLYTAAVVDYINRDFETSRTALRSVASSFKKWDADKLDARMLLEEGHPGQALRDRSARFRFREVVDEVALYSRLQLEGAAAFAGYQHPHLANAHRASMPSATLKVPQTVRRLAVISQDGPGDEIIAASRFAAISERCEQLMVTCDPRLRTLFERSFPHVDFIPSTRLAAHPRPGWFNEEPRVDSALYRLLTADAASSIGAADVSVLSRAVFAVDPRSAPTRPYLVPHPELAGRTKAQLSTFDSLPLIGVAWRSEVRDAIRSVHYLPARALAPLAGMGRLVCLQHDVDHDERDILRAIDPDVIFLDDLDLRDDFEQLVAVTSACDVVVGPGTTTTELSAACGTATVMLHPNRFAAWRSDAVGRDFWHARMSVALPDHPLDPTSCVEAARRIIADQ